MKKYLLGSLFHKLAIIENEAVWMELKNHNIFIPQNSTVKIISETVQVCNNLQEKRNGFVNCKVLTMSRKRCVTGAERCFKLWDPDCKSEVDWEKS